MKKFLICCVICFSALGLLLLMIHFSQSSIHNHYARCMEITNLNYETDVVTCVDAVGFEWQFTECEDYCEGDIICAIMDTMGTDDIRDDVILKTSYSGYNRAK